MCALFEWKAGLWPFRICCIKHAGLLKVMLFSTDTCYLFNICCNCFKDLSQCGVKTQAHVVQATYFLWAILSCMNTQHQENLCTFTWYCYLCNVIRFKSSRFLQLCSPFCLCRYAAPPPQTLHPLLRYGSSSVHYVLAEQTSLAPTYKSMTILEQVTRTLQLSYIRYRYFRTHN